MREGRPQGETLRLDPHSPLPMHAQLEKILRQGIAQGIWPPESRIPSENELSREYGLCRMTVRSVLTRLAQEGLVYRVRGKGTFVAGQKYVGQPLSHMGIREQLERQGVATRTQLIRADLVEAGPFAAEKLGIPAGALLVELLRLRSVGEVPLSLHLSLLPQDQCPGLLDWKGELEGRQLCDLLREKFGVTQEKMVETLEIAQASGEEAKLLQVGKGASLLHVENWIYHRSSVPVEYSSVLFRGDKMKIEICNTCRRD